VEPHQYRGQGAQTALSIWQGKAKKLSDRLESIMQDSPRARPKTKSEYREEAILKFRISKAVFDRAWRQALDNVLEAKPFWTSGGRPKNHPE